jgi:hypothetical protein
MLQMLTNPLMQPDIVVGYRLIPLQSQRQAVRNELRMAQG